MSLIERDERERPPLIVVCNGVEYMRIEPPASEMDEARGIVVVPADQLTGALEERDAYRRELERIADDDLGTWDKAMRHARATLDHPGGQ